MNNNRFSQEPEVTKVVRVNDVLAVCSRYHLHVVSPGGRRPLFRVLFVVKRLSRLTSFFLFLHAFSDFRRVLLFSCDRPFRIISTNCTRVSFFVYKKYLIRIYLYIYIYKLIRTCERHLIIASSENERR